MLIVGGDIARRAEKLLLLCAGRLTRASTRSDIYRTINKIGAVEKAHPAPRTPPTKTALSRVPACRRQASGGVRKLRKK
jgi:hypothetical protein